ncbi:MAG: MFS transporter [Gammaproteobacteria bacterium]|nr:MFS transporter [Gammaproteobacteria bacterium]
MNQQNPNALEKLLKSLSNVEPREIRSVAASFLFVFTLMAAWYILRPVRDQMASDWSDTEVAFLWNINFFVSAAVVALYGFAVSRIQFRILVPTVYAFFGLSFVAFYFLTTGMSDTVLVDKIFYVWVSVFSLFHVSVFWSFMSDLYTKEQSNRLFSIIAVGASAGALVGPLLPALFATNLGIDTLLLIAAVALTIPIGLSLYLERLKILDLHNEDVNADLTAAKIGGNPFAGFKMFVSNPYLLAIGAFILLYTAIGSFVYFEQKNLLAPLEPEIRTMYLARVDLITNILTFITGFFITGRIVANFGMAVTLALVPVFIVAGLLILAFSPILIVVLALQVARRAGNYAITRPAREMLFTAVDRETRFKAKPVIDIVVYRGGDAVSGSLFAALTDGLGFGLAAMAGIGAGIAAVWAAVGAYLGRMFGRKEESASQAGDIARQQA